MSDAALTEALRVGCDRAADADNAGIVSVAGVLRDLADGSDDPLWGLVAALEYHMRLDQPSGQTYGPMMEMGGRIYPTPIERIDDATLALWERAYSASRLALVAGRFADLLWEVRYGDRAYIWAQAAIDNYVRSAEEGFGPPFDIGESLQRSLHLASQLKDEPRRQTVIRTAVAFTQRNLEDDESRPGVVLPLLEEMASLASKDRPAELDRLIDLSVERYAPDPWLLESALGIKAKLASRSDKRELQTRQVQAFARLARQEDGITKYALYQHAIELAEEHGLSELASDLRSEVTSLPEDALGLTRIAVEIPIPRDKVEQFIAHFVGDDDMDSALIRFGAYVPSGSPDTNREDVRQFVADHPLQFLATRMVIGPENSLLKAIQGTEAQEAHALIDHEAQGISVFSIFAVEIIDRIRSRYGAIATTPDWLAGGVIEESVLESVDAAIRHYQEGDWDVTGSLLAPRLERIVRNMARNVGLTITKSPSRDGRPGGVKALGELLRLLDGALDEATRRYMMVLLTEVTGLNLRNRISHGLVDKVSQEEAALLIHAACHLRLLSPIERPATPPA